MLSGDHGSRLDTLTAVITGHVTGGGMANRLSGQCRGHCHPGVDTAVVTLSPRCCPAIFTTVVTGHVTREGQASNVDGDD